MKRRLLRLLSPEIDRLDRHIRVLDAQLYLQKTLVTTQSQRLKRQVTERLRSPWAIAIAFGAGFAAGLLRRSGKTESPNRWLARLRLLRLQMRRAGPLLQSLAGLYGGRRF